LAQKYFLTSATVKNKSGYHGTGQHLRRVGNCGSKRCSDKSSTNVLPTDWASVKILTTRQLLISPKPSIKSSDAFEGASLRSERALNGMGRN
jgi:hypothetical protein